MREGDEERGGWAVHPRPRGLAANATAVNSAEVGQTGPHSTASPWRRRRNDRGADGSAGGWVPGIFQRWPGQIASCGLRAWPLDGPGLVGFRGSALVPNHEGPDSKDTVRRATS